MNRWVKIVLDSLVIGLLLTGLSFFINRADHVNLACVNAPGQAWSQDNASAPYTEQRSGWPFVYYKKIPVGNDKCYAPTNADLAYPHSGPHGLFVGYSDFQISELLKSLAFWILLVVLVDLYLAYVFEPRKAKKRAKQ